MNDLLAPLVALALTAALLALGAWLLPKLRDEKQGYPLEAQIESLVLPYAARAVMLAYEMAERAFQEAGVVMDGSDKKRFADGVYRYLPREVKRWVTPEEWADFVQRAYDEGRALAFQFWEGFEREYQRWQENLELPDAA